MYRFIDYSVFSSVYFFIFLVVLFIYNLHIDDNLTVFSFIFKFISAQSRFKFWFYCSYICRVLENLIYCFIISCVKVFLQIEEVIS